MDADGNDPFHYHLQAKGSTPGCWIVLTSNMKSLGSMIWPSFKCQQNSNLQFFCPTNIFRSWGKTYISKCPSICDIFSQYHHGISWGYLYSIIFSNTVVDIRLNHGQPSDLDHATSWHRSCAPWCYQRGPCATLTPSSAPVAVMTDDGGEMVGWRGLEKLCPPGN